MYIKAEGLTKMLNFMRMCNSVQRISVKNLNDHQVRFDKHDNCNFPLKYIFKAHVILMVQHGIRINKLT